MNIMDIDGVENSLKKLECFLREQDVIVDEIRNIRFNDFYSNGFYQSMCNDIISNLSTVSSMNKDNIFYINSKKEGYINTSRHTNSEFKELGN